MTIAEWFLGELDREHDRSRRALDRVPSGKADWKPHEKSMTFGYLAHLVATMPSWLAMAINLDELDLAPPGSAPSRPAMKDTAAELIQLLDTSVAEARAALEKTSDGHLMTPWHLLVGGTVVMDVPRHVMMRDTVNHLAHHRGQMTVYLRLMGEPVPALYGPSADDRRFT